MQEMFEGATSANPDTSNWDTSNITTMFRMFYGAASDVIGTHLTNMAKCFTRPLLLILIQAVGIHPV